jgi:hypothetical protein
VISISVVYILLLNCSIFLEIVGLQDMQKRWIIKENILKDVLVKVLAANASSHLST